MLAAMVVKLLGITNKEINRKNKRHIPLFRGNSIHENINIFSIISFFSIPKALPKP
jgi:hypothetical protein